MSPSSTGYDTTPAPATGYDSAPATGYDSTPAPGNTDPTSTPLPDETAGDRARRLLEAGKGFVKGAGRTVGGLAHLYSEAPAGSVGMGGQEGAGKLADWLKTRTQLNNPDQKAGNVGETMAEFLIPGLGEEAAAENAAVHGEQGLEAGASAAAKPATVSEQLGNMAKRAKALENDPQLHAIVRIGLKTLRGAATGAGRGAVEQGAQTAVKTGDPEATAESAKTGLEWGGGIGGGAGGLTGAVSEDMQTLMPKIDAILDRARPTIQNIAGAPFETLGKWGANAKMLLRNLGDTARDPATQAVDEATGNIGKTAVLNSANRTNAMRPVEQQPLPLSRQLPGGGGFQVPTGTPIEAPEGELLPPAAKRQQAAFKQPSYVTSSAPRTAMEGPPTLEGNQPRGAPEGTFGADVATATPRTPRADTVTGPGTLILTDQGDGLSVPRARQQLAQWDRILNDPDQVEEMGVRQHAQLTAAREDLAGQLSRYDDFAANQPHLPAADPLEMVRNTDSIGDAAAQLKAHHGAFWQAADKASGGEFSELRSEEQNLRARMNSKTPVEDLGGLREKLAANQQAQMDFFDKYKTSVSPQEWNTARSGYQDGIVLQNLHDLIQREFNGITQPEEARAIAQGGQLRRVFQPSTSFNQKLEDFYNQGFRDSDTNRDVLQRTIGQGHMDDLKTIGQLFEGADRRTATQGLITNVLSGIRRHYHGIAGVLAGGGGAGSLAAQQAGKALGFGGMPLVTGTTAGIRNYITDQLVNDPDFARSFTYAIQNKVPARTAGPLMAARLIAAYKNSQRQQQPPQDQEPQ
jgi:hypothetical protein